jgi:hypothetical protein
MSTINWFSSEVVLLRKAHPSRLAQRLAVTGSEEKRETLEEKERIKFSLIIAEWIQEAHFPVGLQILETANPAETRKRLCGSRRAEALRNRGRAGKVVRDWLLTSTGSPRPPLSFKRCRLQRLLRHGQCCRIKVCFSTEPPMIRHGAAPVAVALAG